MTDEIIPKWFLKVGYEGDEDYEYEIWDTGCSCCASNYKLTKEQLLKLYNDMIEILNNKINEIK